MRRGGQTLVTALGLGLLLLMAACANPAAPRSTSAAAPPAAGREAPTAFRAMEAALRGAARARDQGGASALERVRPHVATTGLALLQDRLPHDLARSDVERFLEGRAVFGGALATWVAVDATDPAALLRDFEALEEAWAGWMAIYRGLPPEHAV